MIALQSSIRAGAVRDLAQILPLALSLPNGSVARFLRGVASVILRHLSAWRRRDGRLEPSAGSWPGQSEDI